MANHQQTHGRNELRLGPTTPSDPEEWQRKIRPKWPVFRSNRPPIVIALPKKTIRLPYGNQMERPCGSSAILQVLCNYNRLMDGG
ncbi:hypothetical protein OUZ56_008259 [Daphnia magna]|uniref:Uncharacterized protein n=1 Tax=Daphnia magna TaxID=35525 RepID=A0ABR0ACG2_9CRUS|nr:hypothetical protein OUZ56_008259 [Daphnia magna]